MLSLLFGGTFAILFCEHVYFTFCFYVFDSLVPILLCLLQRGRIACNAERCISHGNSVYLFVQKNEDRITRSSLRGSKNTLVF